VKAFIQLSAVLLFISCCSISEAQAGTTCLSTGSAFIPIIHITVSDNNICVGTSITFTAVVDDPCSDLNYQWKLNGSNVGSNDVTYIFDKFNNGDIVTCELTSALCLVSPETSNAITMIVSPKTTPVVDITASQTSLCNGMAASITFTADPTGGGPTPFYQWQVNGANTGSNTPAFTTTALSDGDVVQCIMTSDVGCPSSPTASSSRITIKAQPIATPSITIATPNTVLCANGLVTFKATTLSEGNNPVYQWQVNGAAVGNNSPVYTTNTLKNGDNITCMLTSSAPCITSTTAVSNSISVTVINIAVSPSLSIETSSGDICEGMPVIFSATTSNASSSPSYQWQVNGLPAGTDSSVFTSNSLADGDTVNCILLNKYGICDISVPSDNLITMVVRPVPVIAIIPADTSIILGSTIQLSTVISGSIANIEWTPASGLSNIAIANPLAKPLATTTYQLSVLDANGCEGNNKSTIAVFKKLAVPDSFTPNHDGHNDVFRIPPGTFFNLSSLSVFDRWGKRIFTTNDINTGWDGTYKGKPCDLGTYVYIISGSADGKKPVLLKGTVILIR
jgi:gliding motility-associated-like protein